MGKFLRIFAFPIALCYGFFMRIRNTCFDLGLFCKSTSYSIPIISLGNLTVGGTGKTPHIEYLIRLLNPHMRVATLSRGYGRSTRGYRLAGKHDTAKTIGDEPMQYVYKFKKLAVCVSESRRTGIKNLMKLKHSPDVILMDDAYQHRWVKPGLSVLLTDFHKLYTEDYLLPTGSLREPARFSDRADVIIVTKSGKVLSPITRRNIREQLSPQPHQKLYFSYITYEKLTPLHGINCPDPGDCYSTLVLFSGIANTYPLKYYLKKYCSDLVELEYSDHHQYTSKDIREVLKAYNDIFSKNKAIVTTEKDAMRLQDSDLLAYFKGIPIYYIPIKIAFHNEDGELFNEDVLSYISSAKRKA